MKSTYLTQVGKNYWQYQGIYFLVAAITTTLSSLKAYASLASHGYIISYVIAASISMLFCCHVIARGIYKFAEKRNNGIFKNVLWLLFNSIICASVYFLLDLAFYHLSPASFTLNEVFEAIHYESAEGISIPIKIFMAWTGYWTVISAWLIVYSFISSSRFYKALKEQNDSQELKLLLNQINPEFLYATMDAIKTSIDKDTEKAADIVTQASELFRYNLMSSKTNHADINEELVSLNNYLGLLKEQNRSPETIHISLTNQEKIPKLPAMSMIFMLSHILNNAKNQTHALSIEGLIVNDNYKIEMLHTSAKKYKSDLSYLKNLRLRLQHMYQGKAQLNVKKDRQSHKLILILPLVIESVPSSVH